MQFFPNYLITMTAHIAKTSFPTKSFAGLRRVPKLGDGGVFHTPCTDYSRPVEELEYTCLLKNTFTEAQHIRVLDEVDFFMSNFQVSQDLDESFTSLSRLG
jgi:hypothetical protein